MVRSWLRWIRAAACWSRSRGARAASARNAPPGRPGSTSARRGLEPSAALQVALALPVVHDGVVELLLDARGVEVVVDDVLAEDSDRGLRALELPDRLVQRSRHPRHAGRDVAVALELRLELELVLDPVQPRADHRGVRQVGVHVAARAAVLDVQRIPAPDEAE